MARKPKTATTATVVDTTALNTGTVETPIANAPVEHTPFFDDVVDEGMNAAIADMRNAETTVVNVRQRMAFWIMVRHDNLMSNDDVKMRPNYQLTMSRREDSYSDYKRSLMKHYLDVEVLPTQAVKTASVQDMRKSSSKGSIYVRVERALELATDLATLGVTWRDFNRDTSQFKIARDKMLEPGERYLDLDSVPEWIVMDNSDEGHQIASPDKLYRTIKPTIERVVRLAGIRHDRIKSLETRMAEKKLAEESGTSQRAPRPGSNAPDTMASAQSDRPVTVSSPASGQDEPIPDERARQTYYPILKTNSAAFVSLFNVHINWQFDDLPNETRQNLADIYKWLCNLRHKDDSLVFDKSGMPSRVVNKTAPKKAA
jgi:hypothetical protein